MDENLIAKASVTINASSEKVWDALVNPEAIKRYMFGTNVARTGVKAARLFGEESGRVNRMRTKG